jgi:hypothetical protein
MNEGFPELFRIDSTVAKETLYSHNDVKRNTTKNERKGGAKTHRLDGEFSRSSFNSYTLSWYSLYTADPPIVVAKCSVVNNTVHLPTMSRIFTLEK